MNFFSTSSCLLYNNSILSGLYNIKSTIVDLLLYKYSSRRTQKF